VPLAVLVTDEGLNGLVAHVMNDAPTAFAGTLGVRVHQANGAVLVSAEQTVEVAARGSHAQSLDSMLPGFRDLARAYQFGPSVNDVIHVVLSDAAGVERSQLCVLPGGRRRAVEPTVGLTASGRLDEDGSMLVTVSTERFAQFVSIDVAGGIADHDCFDLAPGASRRVVVHPTECGFGSLRSVHALNVAAPATITMER
jgi:beta-mannosidase